MKHLPSIEALSANDDRRLLAELELGRKQAALAAMRAMLDRADRLLVDAPPESVVTLPEKI